MCQSPSRMDVSSRTAWASLAGEKRARYEVQHGEEDERSIVRRGNAAYAAGLAMLMAHDGAAPEWLLRAAGCWRASWDAGAGSRRGGGRSGRSRPRCSPVTTRPPRSTRAGRSVSAVRRRHRRSGATPRRWRCSSRAVGRCASRGRVAAGARRLPRRRRGCTRVRRRRTIRSPMWRRSSRSCGRSRRGPTTSRTSRWPTRRSCSTAGGAPRDRARAARLADAARLVLGVALLERRVERDRDRLQRVASSSTSLIRSSSSRKSSRSVSTSTFAWTCALRNSPFAACRSKPRWSSRSCAP